MSVDVSFDVDIETLERNIYRLIGSYETYGKVPNIPCLIGLKKKRDDLLDKIMAQVEEMGLTLLGNLVAGLVEFYETFGNGFDLPCLTGIKRKRDNYINNIDGVMIGIIENGQD
ncbi:MAG: hypothetical protein AABX29_07235 [Nanoarchaeota archaeon]